MIRKIVQPVYTLYVVVIFLITLIIAIPFISLLSIWGAGARKIISCFLRTWIKCFLWLIGMPLSITGKPPSKGRYIVVANHISYLDSINIFPAIPGYFRPLGKIEFSQIPLVGFIYRQIVIMVDRSSHSSRVQSMRLMQRTLQDECSIFIFPEGTFNETGTPLKDFYDGAFQLAINTQVPILPMVFPDTVHRWHYSAWWKLWPGKNRVAYLQLISTEGMVTEDIEE